MTKAILLSFLPLVYLNVVEKYICFSESHAAMTQNKLNADRLVGNSVYSAIFAITF